jgi:hypothetical protein
MSYIPSQFNPAGLSSRQTVLPDAQFSSVVRQQSLSAQESLNAGLTIKTKEGDVVTLSSNTYAHLDAYSYNSKGLVQSEGGTAVASHNYREVTLSSGEQFSFSVVGDLNEQELEDIEAIVKDIDEIIEEMAKGDMNDAVALALNMGGYDSVSAYSADITYERSYSPTSQTQMEQAALTEETISDPVSENNVLAPPERPIPPVEPFPENTRPWRRKSHSVKNIDHFIEKMAEKFEAMEDRPLAKSKDPVDRLFDHHLNKTKNNKGRGNSEAAVLSEARKQVEKLIEQLTQKVFDQYMSGMLKE